MSILANILGSGDVVKKGMDLIDSFHTSDTEQVEAKTKSKTKLLNAYAPFKIAQRVLAFAFTGVYLACFILAAIMTFTPWGDQDALFALMDAFKIHYIELMIVGFYFGGGAFEGIQERKTERDEIQARSRGQSSDDGDVDHRPPKQRGGR